MRQLSLATAGVIAAAGALSACSVTKSEEPGASVSRSYPVGAFDKIEVAGPYEVTVTTGAQPGVQAQGGENLLARTVVEVKNGTLVIRPEKRNGMNWNWSGRNNKARFTVSVPALSAATIAGSGDISVNKVTGQSFKGEIAGSGGLKLPDVQVGELGLEIAGSGNVEGSGRATQATYTIAGSGNIMAGGIASERLEAEIAGSGNIEANAQASANVDIAGAGNVRVTGGAPCKVSKAGIGNVDCS